MPFQALQLPLYEKVKSLVEEHLRPYQQHLGGKDFDQWKEGIAGVVSGTVWGPEEREVTGQGLGNKGVVVSRWEGRGKLPVFFGFEGRA